MDETKKEGNLYEDIYGVLSDVIVCLSIVTILFIFAVRLVGVDGDSMYPTLHDGDTLILLSNVMYEPEIGDIVVLRAPNFSEGPLVKRLIAEEGQTVDIDFETGEVWVDGVLLDEPYINELTQRYEGVNFPITVPDNCIFVMGDNRMHSTDSRDPMIGCVDEEYVLGKALFTLLPPSRFGAVS